MSTSKLISLVVVTFIYCAIAYDDFNITGRPKIELTDIFSWLPPRDPFYTPDDCYQNQVFHIENETDYAILGCSTRCLCKPGYARAEGGGCVPWSESNITCASNEVPGVGRYNCQKFCDIGPDPLCFKNRYRCKFSYGCFCATGYLRVDNGTCIPEDQCPQLYLSEPEYLTY